MHETTSPVGRALAAARQAQALLAEVVADAPFTALADDDVVALLEAAEGLGRLVDAARIGLTTQIMTRTAVAPGETELCVRYGCRTPTDLVTRLTGISTREVTRRARLGTALDGIHGLIGVSVSPLPEVAASLWQGRIGVESAEVITAGLLPIRHRCHPAGFDAAERALLACATGEITEETAGLPGAGLRFAADLLHQQVQVWAARLDPDGTAPDSPVLQARSRIGFGRLKNGLYPIRGGITPDLRGIMDGLFNTYLCARTRTSFPTEEEQQHANDETVAEDVHGADENEYPATQADTDLRPTDEKRADILRGILESAARDTDTPTIGGQPPSVIVHVNARDLESGTGLGWVDGIDAPINLTTVRQMICTGGTRTIITGNNGQILQMSSKQRCFTPQPTPSDHRTRRRLHHPRLPSTHPIHRSPPRHPLGTRRQNRHHQRGPALLARPPPHRHQRLANPHHQRQPTNQSTTQIRQDPNLAPRSTTPRQPTQPRPYPLQNSGHGMSPFTTLGEDQTREYQ